MTSEREMKKRLVVSRIDIKASYSNLDVITICSIIEDMRIFGIFNKDIEMVKYPLKIPDIFYQLIIHSSVRCKYLKLSI